MSLSNKQKTLTIVAFRQLGINEEDRHRIQAEFGGSPSLRTMRYPGWRNLLKHLGERGFKVQGSRFKGSGFTDEQKTDPQSEIRNPKSKMISKIYFLWYQLAGTYYTPGKEKAALRGFLRKRFRVDHENFLDTPTAIKVIEAIKAIGSRNNVIWD